MEKYNFNYVDGYVTVYDKNTNEPVYEDEWVVDDFNRFAEEAAKNGVPFCEYLEWIIDENILNKED